MEFNKYIESKDYTKAYFGEYCEFEENMGYYKDLNHSYLRENMLKYLKDSY